MADLKDLKLTEADKKAEAGRWDEPEEMDDYPYGLSVRLNNATIEKLALGDLDAGQPVQIVASGTITEDSVVQRGGKPYRSMTIQLQQMAVEQEGEKEPASTVLYGGGNGG